jgi:hypothetical protein
VRVANLGGTGGTLLRASTPAGTPPSPVTLCWAGVFATPGWSASAAGFDVDATTGTALLSVGRWSR